MCGTSSFFCAIKVWKLSCTVGTQFYRMFLQVFLL